MHTITRETVEREKKIDAVLALVKSELNRAMTLHGPMKSLHEAFGVIFEEFNIEFAAEMHDDNVELAQKELVQVAAMACRAIIDVTQQTHDNR